MLPLGECGDKEAGVIAPLSITGAIQCASGAMRSALSVSPRSARNPGQGQRLVHQLCPFVSQSWSGKPPVGVGREQHAAFLERLAHRRAHQGLRDRSVAPSVRAHQAAPGPVHEKCAPASRASTPPPGNTVIPAGERHGFTRRRRNTSTPSAPSRISTTVEASRGSAGCAGIDAPVSGSTLRRRLLCPRLICHDRTSCTFAATPVPDGGDVASTLSGRPNARSVEVGKRRRCQVRRCPPRPPACAGRRTGHRTWSG